MIEAERLRKTFGELVAVDGVTFLDSQPCQLKLIKNPSQRILPEIIEEVASVLAEGASYL